VPPGEPRCIHNALIIVDPPAASITVQEPRLYCSASANEAFNITNGDVFEWRNVWPALAIRAANPFRRTHWRQGPAVGP
jgi:hypothetical protein